ncbi:putative metalloprotease [Apodospora peruviana]|uniref:Metalloprotease n=1 Tax=Apodospora peruviana TaxID=516989 RepID=A0AAE0I0M1_9PEZI|nr:putative metalloprotease [Apodospora peruviana]
MENEGSRTGTPFHGKWSTDITCKTLVLLIQDPDTDKAAAAMDFNVGSLSDPEDIPGTAHAVEHFCFMGTKKRYSEYLANPNSSSVGVVAVKIPLHGALDGFAQFFVQPLFLADTLDRELGAMDSEYKQTRQSDSWRLEQVARSTSSGKHPYHKFAASSYQCLSEEPASRGVDIRKRFMGFYEAHYSANRMRLSPGELESWVQELFADVPNKNLPRPRRGDDDDYFPAFDEPQLATQVFVKPVMDHRLLNIDFAYPGEEHLLASQPSRCLSHLIGHEGPGSLLVYLKAMGLAEWLWAEASARCVRGMRQYREVLVIPFQYIAMLKDELNPQPPAWISDEMRPHAEPLFAARVPAQPNSLIRKFDPENILSGLSYLRPDNFRFFEKWHDTDYKMEKIPQDFMQQLWAATGADPKNRPEELRSPSVNEFLPQRLHPTRHPTLIRHDDNVRVWWKKDDQFWVPKANIRLLLRSPVASLTPLNAVMTRLYVELVLDSLRKYAYNAEIAGLRYSLSESVRGLNLEFNGFSDKDVLRGLRHLDVKQDQLEVAKERVRKASANFDFRDPHRQINIFSRMLISDRSWAPFQKLGELAGVTVEDMHLYVPHLLRQMHVELLVHGNLDKEEALQMADLVKSTKLSQQFPESQWQPRRAIALPSGSHYLYERVLWNLPDNVNNCLEYILSIGSSSSPSERAKLLPFGQIAKEPCFDALRTKEQLGYIVDSDVGFYTTVGTWPILVQSERGRKYLKERCDAFLVKLGEDLRKMTDGTFEEHKVGLINQRLEKLNNLEQETERETFDFEQAQHDVETLQVLSKNDMPKFFDQYIHPSSATRAKLSMHLIAQTTKSCSKAAASVKVEEDGAGAAAAAVINGHHDNMGSSALSSSTKNPAPVVVQDVSTWKAALPLSTAPNPVKGLGQFAVPNLLGTAGTA